MSEHNSLLCGGELHDSLFLILSQLSCTTPWQLYVSIHQVGLLICNKHDKLMVKMTILFFTVYNLQYLHCKEGIVIMTDSLLFQIQMSEHNSLLCGGGTT